MPRTGILRRTFADVKIRNGAIELSVTIDGEDDAPPVVLLHGIISSGRTWDWIVPRLVDRHRVIRLDFRGHGDSDRAPGAYGLADYLSDAIAVCEQVAATPAPVIGHSLGGVTAAALAQQRPDLTTRVLLEDAPLSIPRAGEGGGDANALLDAFRLMRRSIPELQANGVTEEQLTGILVNAPIASGGTFGERLLDDGIATMASGMLRVDATVLDPVLDGTMGRELDPTRPIDVPVTAIAADPSMPDAATRPADLEQLAATSRAVDSLTVSDVGHMIHDSKLGREVLWQAVARFLA
jgi:pimeloyl-ACP methyl ester carboxylesterase